MRQKMLSLLLSAAMLVSLTVVPATAEEGEGPGGHWAQGAADRWAEAGVVQGDSNGDLRLDDSLTRGELATIFVKTLGLTEKSENTYADLRGDEWYADAILMCTAAGIMKGDGVNCNAIAKISRQETTVMTARALGIEPEANPDLSAFQDGDQVAEWAGGYISAMQKAQIIEGMGDGSVAPAADINRASMLTILDKAITTYIHEPGEYELTGSGIVIVKASGEVKLTGELKGDVLVAPGAAGGAVTASGLKVDGAVKLQADNVALKADGLTAASVTVSGDNAAVEMKNSTVDAVAVDGGAVKVSGENLTAKEVQLAGGKADVTLTKSTVTNVSVAGDSGKLSVTDTKVTGTMTVEDPKAEVNLGSGSKVEKIQATGDAAGAEINVAKGATVSTVTAESAVKIDNKGTVSKLEAKADDIVVDGNKPAKTEVDKGVDKPTDSKGNDVSKPSTGGSSGGSDDGGGSNPPVPTSVTVTNKDGLTAALANAQYTTINISGIIGGSSAYDIYTITRAVTLRGGTVYGSFIVTSAANGAVFDGVTIWNQGDAENANTAARNAISANCATLTIQNCRFNMTSSTTGIANGVSIWPSAERVSYTITNNTFEGYQKVSGGYTSAALLISGGIQKENVIAGMTMSVPATMTDTQDLAIITNNHFSNCASDYCREDWTSGSDEVFCKAISHGDNLYLEGAASSAKYYITGNITRVSDMTVKEGTTLVISEGAVLTMNAVLTNNGSVVNNGSIANNSSITNTGTLSGTGTLLVQDEAGLLMALASDIANVSLNKNFSLSALAVIPAAHTITLDLNDKELTLSTTNGTIKVLGNLTLQGTSNGKITVSDAWKGCGYGMIEVNDGGALVMDGGEINATFASDTTSSEAQKNGCFAITVFNDSSFTMNGGTIRAGWYAVSTNGTTNEDKPNYGNNATITINNGELISTGDFAIYAPALDGRVLIKNGTVKGDWGAVQMKRGNLTIEGGSFTTTGDGTNEKPADQTDGSTPDGVVTISQDKTYGEVTVSITGGTYSASVSAYCPDGYSCIENDGIWTVSPAQA